MAQTFTLQVEDTASKARAGLLHTSHGCIQTPIFMPVGTLGAVKGIHMNELKTEINAQIILGNTYHLFLRPGIETIHLAGGLHHFNSWHGPILTDSGGYQVFSLAHRRKITTEGVIFQSHIDGSKHLFTPENVTDIQLKIGADIFMAFDECTPYPCEYNYAEKSLKITHDWLDRCINQFSKSSFPYHYESTLAPIVQGSTYTDLRRRSAEYISSKGLPINAIGGLSVGEPHDEMYKMTDIVTDILPKMNARYLMGVGIPENILECIALGIDMFDCVLPSRNARHGLLYTWNGVINIKNEKWKNDFSKIDEQSKAQTSLIHSKSFLRHLIKTNEILGAQIATLHNLAFYIDLVTEARKQIIDGTFYNWKKAICPHLNQRI